MKGVDVVLLINALSGLSRAADTPRPRGVGPDFAKFYKSSDTFACISNPSIQISFSQVNDEYCDCPDGSDEPGTSACSYLSPLSPKSPTQLADGDANPSLVLPGFYCKNKGHNAGYIPFTLVNDGICDYDVCCDGSDEWAAVGGIKCENKCAAMGKAWKAQEQARQNILKQANKKRKEFVEEGARLRQEVQNKIEDAKSKIDAQQEKVTVLEREVAALEKTEKSRVVKASGTGGKLGVLITLAKDKLSELRSSTAVLKDQRDALHDSLEELEGILTKFKEEYNPNYNDEGVKRAVRAWEDYAARAKPEHEYAEDPDISTFLAGEDGIDWEEYSAADVPDDVAALYSLQAYLPASLREWIDDRLKALREFLVNNGMLASNPTNNNAAPSKELLAARGKAETAASDLHSTKSDLKNAEEDLAKDYGPDDVFRALSGKCVELDSGEYTYELCWMGEAKQKSKKGGATTSLGDFARFETMAVDTGPLPADGRGLGSGDRIAMKYENGQHCWNGPNRSVTVVLACFEREEIWRVAEEEKCVYRMEVGTPAACEAQAAAAAAGGNKDEL